MRRLIGFAIACALAGASSAALADDGYVTGTVTMYAGPDMSYPAVDTIPAGEPVAIEGCDDGYGWCDVIWGEDRGWIPGNYIQYEYNDQPVLLPAYAAVIGIPIVTFAIADYWGRYYHNRLVLWTARALVQSFVCASPRARAVSRASCTIMPTSRRAKRYIPWGVPRTGIRRTDRAVREVIRNTAAAVLR